MAVLRLEAAATSSQVLRLEAAATSAQVLRLEAAATAVLLISTGRGTKSNVWEPLRDERKWK